ncbi:b3/4 domain-containing protein [Phthorimaea operculella]|nr:b3/4 domain-containing protein [Phthorimaea operculella]
MPTISVKRDSLFKALGKTYTDDEFQDLCFAFGLELDEVTTEKQMLQKEQGDQAGVGVSEDILYRIDIPANRYDLLCLEGLVNGLLVFQGKKAPPEYKLKKYEDCYSLHLTPATAQIRPYAVAAILRAITFTKESYDSFIDLQDKLHQNICRKRTLVAIGTHDLDTIQGPFVYDALPPDQIKFQALNQPQEMTATQLMDLYSGPFVYDALPPEQIKFQALNQPQEMTATQLMDLYSGPFVYDALPPDQIKFQALNQPQEMTATQLMELYSATGHDSVPLCVRRSSSRPDQVPGAQPAPGDDGHEMMELYSGPFVYDLLPPDQIKFQAHRQPQEMTATQLMELYSSHAQLKAYLPIIRDSPVYPVIKDKNGVVLSMPPIINGDHSKITLNTKNVFIECTATDLNKAQVVLDTIVCMFSEYCAKPYEVQQCKVFAPDGTYQLTPRLHTRQQEICVDQPNKYIGISETAENISAMLSRMCLTTSHEDSVLRVRIPPTRHDVIHACDLYEDIAIAYGYNNIPRRPSRVVTSGAQEPVNKLTEQLRQACAHAGYTEALTFTLCSRDDVATRLGQKIEDVPAVHISNPKTLEFQVVRTMLLPGLLKTLAANKKMPLPLRLFEISDVVLQDKESETGARNERRLCAVHCGRSAGFQYVHGLLDRVMLLLRAQWSPQGYRLRACSGMCSTLLPVRARAAGPRHAAAARAVEPPGVQAARLLRYVQYTAHSTCTGCWTASCCCCAPSGAPRGTGCAPAQVCAVHCAQYVHGLLDRVMLLLRARWSPQGYRLRACSDPAYFPGRCAEVVLHGDVIGKVGVLHPTTLAAFELTNPVAALEINIQPFV